MRQDRNGPWVKRSLVWKAEDWAYFVCVARKVLEDHRIKSSGKTKLGAAATYMAMEVAARLGQPSEEALQAELVACGAAYPLPKPSEPEQT